MLSLPTADYSLGSPDITPSEQYDGLTESTQDNTTDGPIGDAGSPKDWLSGAVKDAKGVVGIVGDIIGLFNGGKATTNNSLPGNAVQPISQQGGALTTQNTASSPLAKVPVWGWFVAGGVFLVGLIALLIPKRKKKA